MNDAELDQLIAAAATVSDAEVMAWDLAAPEAHLREEIMSTTASPSPAASGPSGADGTSVETSGPTGVDAAADVEPIVIDLARTARPSRPPRRRRALALAAAAVAVLAAVGAVTLAGDDPGDDPADFRSDRQGGEPGDPVPGGDAGPAPSSSLAEADAAITGMLTIAARLDGWATVYVDVPTPAEGEITMANVGAGGAQDWQDHEVPPGGIASTLYITWGPADRYDEWVADFEDEFGPGAATTVTGEPALTFAHEPATPEGADGVRYYYETVWRVGDRAVLAQGVMFRSPAEHEALTAALDVVPPEEWVASLPADAVLPSQWAATVDRMLADVPRPAGFDAAPLRAAPEGVRNRYQVGYAATQPVVCAWIDGWVAARESGDTAAAQAAVDAMATSRDWDVLTEMQTEGDWPDAVWTYADALQTDGPVPGGRPLTIAEGYEASLGC